MGKDGRGRRVETALPPSLSVIFFLFFRAKVWAKEEFSKIKKEEGYGSNAFI